MKRFGLLLVFTLCFAFLSCNKEDDGFKDYVVAKPLMMTKAQFKESVTILPPRQIKESGKIYTYKNLVFVNDKYQGVHVIDNSDPVNPVKINFIQIPGNVDISVKDDFLYADSIMDLLVFDISNINDVKEVNRLEGVLQQYISFPVEADIYDWEDVDYNLIQVGWETSTKRLKVEEYETQFNRNNINAIDMASTAESSGGTGQGGSLARFKIVNDYLYAVDSHNINIFKITTLDNPLTLESIYAGFDIETIFNRGEYLFLGSMRGMYIYDIKNPAKPKFVSEFQHGTACDPVVVDGDYAYVTLRGGNGCGATESGLFIIDISNIENPELKKMYAMDEPYGIGIKGEKLFICDGKSGLKVYDKSDVENLVSLNHFDDIITFDVVPLEDNLLMIGDEVLYQYEYLEDGIKLISTFALE